MTHDEMLNATRTFINELNAGEYSRRELSINSLSTVTDFIFAEVDAALAPLGANMDDVRDLNMSVPLVGDQFDRDVATLVSLVNAENKSASVNVYAMRYSVIALFKKYGVGRTQKAAADWEYAQPGLHHAD